MSQSPNPPATTSNIILLTNDTDPIHWKSLLMAAANAAGNRMMHN